MKESQIHLLYLMKLSLKKLRKDQLLLTPFFLETENINTKTQCSKRFQLDWDIKTSLLIDINLN